MAQWMKSKLVLLLMGLVALLATLGVSGVAAAQTRGSNSPGVEDQKILGTIKSVNMNLSFVLLPDGKQGTITIFFDAHTNIEGGSTTLAVGTHVSVEALKRVDGSLYATEIKRSAVNQVNQANRVDNDANDDRGRDRDHHDVNDDRGHDNVENNR